MFKKKFNIILGAPTSKQYLGFITFNLNTPNKLFVIGDNQKTLDFYYDHLKRGVSLDHHFDTEVVEFSFKEKPEKVREELNKLFETRDQKLLEVAIKNYDYDKHYDGVKPIIAFIRDVPKTGVYYLAIAALLIKSARYGIYPIIFDTEDGAFQKLEFFPKIEVHIEDLLKDDLKIKLGEDSTAHRKAKTRKVKHE